MGKSALKDGTAIRIPPVLTMLAFVVGFAIVYWFGIVAISFFMTSSAGIFLAVGEMVLTALVTFALIILVIIFWKFPGTFISFLLGMFIGGLVIALQATIFTYLATVGVMF